MNVDVTPVSANRPIRRCFGVLLPEECPNVWSGRCWMWQGSLKMTGKLEPYPHWFIEPDERSVN